MHTCTRVHTCARNPGHMLSFKSVAPSKFHGQSLRERKTERERERERENLFNSFGSLDRYNIYAF